MPCYTFMGKFVSLIISSFSKGDRKRTRLETLPKFAQDSNLISWGLISNPFGHNQTQTGRRVGRKMYQTLILMFEWLMLLKLLFSMVTHDQYIRDVYIGDFAAFLPGKRIYYHLPIVCWTSLSVLSATLFFLSTEKSGLSWLKLFELCKGSLECEDIGMESEEAEYFWQRSFITTWFTKFMIQNFTLISLLLIAYVFSKLWPKDDLMPYGLIWAFVSMIWVYYTLSIQFGVMAVFHQICYYFMLRFEKANRIAKQLETVKTIDTKSKHEKIYMFMLDHNDICAVLYRYNHFWQFNMAFVFVVYIPLICFITYLIVFTEMPFITLIVLFATIFGAVCCFCVITFSAGSVAEEAHNSYCILNSITQKQMPLTLKSQLQIYIQRLGGPTIGFSCLDLFTVTFDSFLSALLMVTSFFLLFMDVSQSEIRNNRNAKTFLSNN